MRIGVVGTGYLGKLHARVLTEMPPENGSVAFIFQPAEENEGGGKLRDPSCHLVKARAMTRCTVEGEDS